MARIQCKYFGCLHNDKVSRDCMNTAGRITLSQTAVRRAPPKSPSPSNFSVCVCVCVRACVRACVCVCERARGCVYVLFLLFNVEFLLVWLLCLFVYCVCFGGGAYISYYCSGRWWCVCMWGGGGGGVKIARITAKSPHASPPPNLPLLHPSLPPSSFSSVRHCLTARGR